MAIADPGREDPTISLTNDMAQSPANWIGRYARRMLIENNIADGIDSFHMDALSSEFAMKVNCDLQLTLMASSLYRLLAPALAMATKLQNPGTSSATSLNGGPRALCASVV